MFTENNFCEVVRGIAGDLVEEVSYILIVWERILAFTGIKFTFQLSFNCIIIFFSVPLFIAFIAFTGEVN